MNVTVNSITGIEDAIASMYLSKRTWTPEIDKEIRRVCNLNLSIDGSIAEFASETEKYEDWMQKLTKWGRKHITMLRFIDISVTVEGLHRAGQDDWDSHAARFNNRIIRSSTRLASFGYEMSDYYRNKVIPTDVALNYLAIDTPDTIEVNGEKYVKTINGYIREDMKNNQDVKRGLYMLSIPSNFIFKVNLTEWAHVYKERNKNGGANPEVKQCCEMIADQLQEMQPTFTRELFMEIKN